MLARVILVVDVDSRLFKQQRIVYSIGAFSEQTTSFRRVGFRATNNRRVGINNVGCLFQMAYIRYFLEGPVRLLIL